MFWNKNKENILIKYFSDDLIKLEKISKGDWIDLRAAKTVNMKAGEVKMIPLGIAMKLPEGYEAHVVPRSSTYKSFGITQVNSIGIIDNSYNGPEDQWHFPALSHRVTTINKNDRICQFRIVRNQPEIVFITSSLSEFDIRGGFGTTGSGGPG